MEKEEKLSVGIQLSMGQTVYVYASSKDKLCIDESSFTIDYEDCPISRGISPNNDGLNDIFDLTPQGGRKHKNLQPLGYRGLFAWSRLYTTH